MSELGEKAAVDCTLTREADNLWLFKVANLIHAEKSNNRVVRRF